jgi:hypothetical protein
MILPQEKDGILPVSHEEIFHVHASHFLPSCPAYCGCGFVLRSARRPGATRRAAALQN